jgi:hypothetical protein
MPAAKAPVELTPWERTQIQLEEYKALRSEIGARLTYGFQTCAVAMGAITFVLSQPGIAGWRLAGSLIFILSFGFFVFWAVSVRDVWRAARRVREIEGEVNRRAGEPLLTWELLHAPGSQSQWGAIFPKSEPDDKSERA